MTFDSNSVPYLCTSCDRVVTTQTAQRVAQETAKRVAEERKRVAEERKGNKQFFFGLGIFTLVAALLLIIGYSVGSVALQVIGWIGVGLVILYFLMAGWAILNDWLSSS